MASQRTIEDQRRARELSGALGEALLGVGAKAASCESCTSGLVADAISSRPGASAWFEVGLVCYSERAKTMLAGVDPALFKSDGVVSRKVAVAMAKGVAGRADCRFGVGVTGLAGPGGGEGPSGPLPEGWICVAAWDLSRDVGLAVERRFEGNREEARAGAALAAIELLLAVVEIEIA